MSTRGKKLIIHMGLHKTGTKSVQSFFSEFRDEIANSGLYYPMSGCTGQERAHHNIYRYYSDNTQEKSQFNVRAGGEAELKSELRNVDKDILLSSEGFWVLARDEPTRFAEFVSSFSDEREVLFVITWRNAAEYCESLYFQHAKEKQMVGIDKAVRWFFSMPAEFETVVTFLRGVKRSEILILPYCNDMLDLFLRMLSARLAINIDEKLKGARQNNPSLSSAQKLIAAHLSVSDIRFTPDIYKRILEGLGEGTAGLTGGDDGSIMPTQLQAKLIDVSVQGLRSIVEGSDKITLYPDEVSMHIATRPYLLDEGGLITFPKLRGLLEAIL